MASTEEGDFPMIPPSLVYRDAVQSLPAEYQFIDEDGVQSAPFWETNLDDYLLCGKVGSGRFSDAYAMYDVRNKGYVCGKILRPASISKMAGEIHTLRVCSALSIPHTIRLHRCLHDPASSTRTLIFDHVNHIPDWKKFYSSLSVPAMRTLMLQILIGLNGLHKAGIMHRDVKPQNMLVDGDQLTAFVGDLGLAALYRPGETYKTSVGSRYYKAPELVLKCPRYSYAADMWGAGCILATMMLHTYPLFRGNTSAEHLKSVVKIIGSDEIIAALPCLGLHMPGSASTASPYASPEIAARLASHGIDAPVSIETLPLNDQLADVLLRGPTRRTPLRSLGESPVFDDAALDLAERLLTVNPYMRLTAEEAIQHPFFDEIRDQFV